MLNGNKGKWALRPGDLPPAWMIRREPRLAGVANNAMFRAVVFNLRRRPLVWALQVIFVVVFVGMLALVECIQRPGGVSWRSLAEAAYSQNLLWYPVIFALQSFSATVILRGDGFHAGFFYRSWMPWGIPKDLTNGLREAGFSGDDMARGLWGAMLRRNSWAKSLLGAAAIWICAWFLLWEIRLMAGAGLSIFLLGLIPMLMTAFLTSRLFYEPWVSLLICCHHFESTKLLGDHRDSWDLLSWPFSRRHWAEYDTETFDAEQARHRFFALCIPTMLASAWLIPNGFGIEFGAACCALGAYWAHLQGRIARRYADDAYRRLVYRAGLFMAEPEKVLGRIGPWKGKRKDKFKN